MKPKPIMDIDSYIDYVGSVVRQVEYLRSIIYENEVRPHEINMALAQYFDIQTKLIAEYQRRKIEYMDAQERFDEWYDLKFEDAKKSVLSDYRESKSIKPSIKEFETRLRNLFREEYRELQAEVKEKESKMRFLLRMADAVSKYDKILVSLANNARSEMISLSLNDRMNRDEPRRIRKKAIVSEDDESTSDED